MGVELLPVLLKEHLGLGIVITIIMILLVWGGWKAIIDLSRYAAHGRRVDEIDVSERMLAMNDKWAGQMEQRLSTMTDANTLLMTQVSEYQMRTAELERKLLAASHTQEVLGQQVSLSNIQARQAMEKCEELDRRCAALERESHSRARLITALEKQVNANTARLDQVKEDMDELLTWVRQNVPAEKLPTKWGTHHGRPHAGSSRLATRTGGNL